MKKFITIITSILLCFTLTGCGNSHKELIDFVENKEYDKAIEYINNLAYEDAINNGTIDKEGMRKALIDEWVLYDSSEYKDVTKLVFNDDSTVLIDDQKYLWEIQSENEDYISVSILDGASKFAIADISANSPYKLAYSVYNSEKDSYTDYRNFFSDANYEKVEITKDNFDTYFEIADYHYFSEDSFGDVTNVSFGQYIKLKDSYYEKLCPENYKIAYEVSYDRCDATIKVDYEKEIFEVKKVENATSSDKTKGETHKMTIGEKECFGSLLMTNSESKEYYDKKTSLHDNHKIIRVEGHFYLAK